MTNNSLTKVGVDVKEYIEQEDVEKSRDRSRETERERMRREE